MQFPIPAALRPRRRPPSPGTALLASALLALLPAEATATPQAAGPPAAGPLHQSQVRYSASGPVVVQGMDARVALPSTTTLCWDNSNTPPTAGNFAVGEEVVDWGVKACLETGVVRGFQLGYRTTALDPARGGVGAALTVAFYEGTTGSGVLGTETARYTLSGLPASTTGGTSSDHVVLVDLGNYPFCYGDGEVGFGFVMEDGLTQPLLTVAPNAALGTQNLLDLYSPAPASSGTFQGSFNMGPGMPFGSLYLRVYEDAGTIQADSTIVNGSGVNPLVYSELAPAVLGESWLTKVDLSGFPAANFTVQVLSANPGIVVPSAFGELLVDLADPGLIAGFSFGIHAQLVPKDTFILGRTFHSQAAVFQPTTGPILTNGIDVVPGF